MTHIIELNKLKPARDGADCDGLFSLQPHYVGGRRDGQLAPVEWQPFRRCESGQPLEEYQQPPDKHYLLFVDRRSLRYIHSSLLPADYKYTEDPASE